MNWSLDAEGVSVVLDNVFRLLYTSVTYRWSLGRLQNSWLVVVSYPYW